MQRTLIAIGIVIIIIGIGWPYLSKLPIGRLPGDIIVDRPNMTFYFPVTTMILVSIIVSVILWILRK